MNGHAYYNEFDPYAAEWLRNLIKAGLIADGEVDTRSIVDVRGDNLRGFVQCHFFAGLGGWSYALRLAGWEDDCPVWTGSCPCQPLSSAGLRKGHADERHLWPAFYSLIAECGPAIVFGEQVAGTDGREWLAGVRADLEAVGYACGAADLCAAGVAAPHIRQRLYWVADAQSQRCGEAGRCSKQSAQRPAGGGVSADRLGNATGAGFQGQWREYRPSGERHSGLVGFAMQDGVPPQWNGPTIGIKCSDGPRRISAQPGTFPLAYGVSGRMGKLRASGNAITPQVGAEFIKAVMDVGGCSL